MGQAHHLPGRVYPLHCLADGGGGLELVDIKDWLVYCRLTGACTGCAGAAQTLKMMVEKTLKEVVDERVRVIAV